MLWLFFIISFSSPVWAFTGSITDPSLSTREEDKSQAVQPSLKLKSARNLRISRKDFLNINQKNNIFDTLSINADLIIRTPFNRFSYFEKFEFLNNKSFFSVLSYSSLALYNSPKIKENHCWASVFCFTNLSVGLNSPLFNRGKFHGTYSLYFNLPVSKFRIQKQSFFLGIGGSLSTQYQLLSEEKLHVSALSSHLFDLDGYGHRTNKVSGYNEPLSMAHQLGLEISYSLSKFIPTLYVYGQHGSSLRFSGVLRQQLNLNWSAVWLLGEKLRFLVGLRWGDEVFSQNVMAPSKRIFFADDTYITFGGNYLF